MTRLRRALLYSHVALSILLTGPVPALASVRTCEFSFSVARDSTSIIEDAFLDSFETASTRSSSENVKRLVQDIVKAGGDSREIQILSFRNLSHEPLRLWGTPLKALRSQHVVLSHRGLVYDASAEEPFPVELQQYLASMFFQGAVVNPTSPLLNTLTVLSVSAEDYVAGSEARVSSQSLRSLLGLEQRVQCDGAHRYSITSSALKGSKKVPPQAFTKFEIFLTYANDGVAGMNRLIHAPGDWNYKKLVGHIQGDTAYSVRLNGAYRAVFRQHKDGTIEIFAVDKDTTH